ncbi:hypothetical protein NM208_g12286 [Fusarium decemcellulare]|uniref:Uncharacterized protein n=1 Tax=Fusarium decemcellulare TaxID=57161 RepID=A0ACC1RP90_9HYPO|nr:hypothetical protein NM208_g12286 [Fusarium decemcellulare]
MSHLDYMGIFRNPGLFQEAGQAAQHSGVGRVQRWRLAKLVARLALDGDSVLRAWRRAGLSDEPVVEVINVTTVAYYSSPLYWQIAPAAIPLPRTVVLPTISIKVIFHRAGTILASNDVYYDSPPSRNTILANLSYWSQGHGLGDRVYSGQATLYLTSSFLSTLTILPGTGPVRPAHAVRTMSLAEQTSVWEFEAIMAQIPTRGLGAFLVVDMQGPRNNQNPPPESNPPDDPQSPPSPDPPADSANTDDTSPPAPGAESDNGQTPPEPNHSELESKGEDNDEVEPSGESVANG